MSISATTIIVFCILIISFCAWNHQGEGFIGELFPETKSLAVNGQAPVGDPGPPIGWNPAPNGRLMPGPGSTFSQSGLPILTGGATRSSPAQTAQWVRAYGPAYGPTTGIASISAPSSPHTPNMPTEVLKNFASIVPAAVEPARIRTAPGNISSDARNDTTRVDAPSSSGAVSSNRTFNNYGDKGTDTSKFDWKTAQSKGAGAFDDDGSTLVPRPTTRADTTTSTAVKRVGIQANYGSIGSVENVGNVIVQDTGTRARGSNNSAGGSSALNDSHTNNIVIDTGTNNPGKGERKSSPDTTPTPAPQPSGAERDDHKCGPTAGGAKCGVGRCCSTTGLCGGANDPQCQAAANDPAYNGPNAMIQGVPGPCTFTCGAPALDSAKYYYDSAGPYANTYVMVPQRAALSSPDTCDIIYSYAAPASPATPLGIDKRRFHFRDVGGCNWQAYAVDGTMSGSMVT